MNSETKQVKKEPSSFAGDMWGGLTAMLVALPSSIAFGVLTYTVMGPEYAGAGAMAGMLGAAALGIVAPFFGRTAGLISAPCAPAAAVLSATILGFLGGKAGPAISPQSIPLLLAMMAALSALLQILYGAIGGGRLIKYIPYPVVTGYLSGVGVLIALGQLPKLFGLPKGIPLSQGLATPELWQWQGLLVGVVTILLMSLAPRFTKKIPATIIGISVGIITYFILSFFSPELLTLSGNQYVIGPVNASASFFDIVQSQIASLVSINFSSIVAVFIPALTLSVLLSVDTLKTCVGLDALTRTRHKSDRELIGQGIGNFASFLVGGMPGAGTMGPTLVNVSSGGRSFRSGLIEGIFVILAIVLFGKLIAWVPISSLAGIMLVIAWRMFDKRMFRLLLSPAGKLDFTVIIGVVIVSVAIDLIAAAGVGVALSILLFIRDQTRGEVIHRKLYLNQISSKTHRLDFERDILSQHGDQAVFCELQGNLFFGTTDQLFSQLETDLRTKRFILLDLRRVQSMDYTAAHLFEQMHAQLAERGGQLLFSGMPSELLEQRNFEHYLVQLGVVREGGGIMVVETMDSALEWMEEQIIQSSGAAAKSEERLLEVNDFSLFREFDDAMHSMLSGCMGTRLLDKGEKVFSYGDDGDEMFLVRRGSVRIMLPLEGGKRHHLATISQGDFFGELTFIDRSKRSADVEAKVSTDLFVLSRARFNELAKTDPTVGVRVFARLASTIGVRLRQADAELRLLQDR